jgi:DNA-binding GntR family transcriptional regulator
MKVAHEEDHRSAAARLDTTLRAQAQSLLRNAILDGHFTVGQKLVERELCAFTGASRSVLREALVNLEANGLIERQSYCGFSVVQLNAQTVREIFELRSSLETFAAELFTERASAPEMAALSDAQRTLEECLVTFDLGLMRNAKERYYEVLFTGCRNGEVRRALEHVIDRIYLLRSRLLMDPARREHSLVEMRRLTAALINRDRLEARAASLAHLEAARDAMLIRLAQSDAEADVKTRRRRVPAA